MVCVESEAIAEVEYEQSTSTLFVRFTDSHWYTYFAVRAAVHAAFVAAESHGKFFHDHIRDRYPYRRGR